MWFPTVRKVIGVHEEILRGGGGESGILNRGAIASAVARCRYGPFPVEPTLALRAALLLRGIAQDHPLADGNKRTAFASADLFLERNGAILSAEEDAIVVFMVEVAQGEHTVPQLARWIQEHLRKR